MAIFYEVAHNGKKNYIFATSQSTQDDACTLPSEIQNAFLKSEFFISEKLYQNNPLISEPMIRKWEKQNSNLDNIENLKGKYLCNLCLEKVKKMIDQYPSYKKYPSLLKFYRDKKIFSFSRKNGSTLSDRLLQQARNEKKRIIYLGDQEEKTEAFYGLHLNTWEQLSLVNILEQSFKKNNPTNILVNNYFNSYNNLQPYDPKSNSLTHCNCANQIVQKYFDHLTHLRIKKIAENLLLYIKKGSTFIAIDNFYLADLLIFLNKNGYTPFPISIFKPNKSWYLPDEKITSNELAVNSIKNKLKNAFFEYQSWIKKQYTIRLFNFHGNTGIKRAAELVKEIEKEKDFYQIIKKIHYFFNHHNARYRNHSFISFFLDQIKKDKNIIFSLATIHPSANLLETAILNKTYQNYFNLSPDIKYTSNNAELNRKKAFYFFSNEIKPIVDQERLALNKPISCS